MRLGLIVRGVDRGLGIQTWEIYRHMKPAVTVLIDSLPDRGKWKFHPDRFPDAIVTEWEGYTAPISVEAEEALLSTDVVMSVETPYSTTLFPRAREKGIATVLYVNPELWREHETEHASAVWVPSKWRINHIPKAELVPMPVALDRLKDNPVGERFLHLGGHKARSDRNGMEVSIRAARNAGIPLVVTSQDPMQLSGGGLHRGPTLDNYWEMYEGYGVLVMPRKYGGLCLPVQEAMAAGLAVVMSDTSPNDDWPVARVRCTRTQRIRMPGGQIDLYETNRGELVAEMLRMNDPDYRGEWQAKGRAWAEKNSWDWYRAEWLARLAELS